MRSALPMVLALVVLTSASATEQVPVPPQKPTLPIAPGNSSIVGRIVDRTTEQPLSDVLVTVLSLDRVRALVTATDSAGRYAFSHIAAGEYRVAASHPEYVPMEFGLKEGRIAMSARDSVIALDHESTRTGVNFSLVRGATISGRVLRHDGQGLKDANVIAFQVSDDGGLSMLANGSVRTNARGEYELKNLAEGHYRVTATWMEEGVRAPLSSRMRMVHYPGTTLSQELVPVPVSAGATAKNIDIVFPASELLRISGRIVRSTAEGDVEAMLMNGTAAQPVTVAPDGTFTTPYVRTGRHTLVVRARSEDVMEAASITFDVSSDLTDLVLGLMATGAIAGRVVTDEGTPVPGEMQVAAVLADEGKELDEYRRDRSPIGSDGAFTVRGLFGQRVMRMVGVTAGWKIARVTLRNDDVTTLSVAPGVTIDDVLIVLTRT
jgi:hypothetical protein